MAIANTSGAKREAVSSSAGALTSGTVCPRRNMMRAHTGPSNLRVCSYSSSNSARMRGYSLEFELVAIMNAFVRPSVIPIVTRFIISLVFMSCSRFVSKTRGATIPL